jgi:hypothetical protein
MLLCLYTHVSSACVQVFIYFKRILQMFHLKVSKVDRGVAWAGGWRKEACRSCLLLLLGRSRGSTHVGSPCGCGPTTDTGADAGRDADARAWDKMWTRGVGRDVGGELLQTNIPSGHPGASPSNRDIMNVFHIFVLLLDCIQNYYSTDLHVQDFWKSGLTFVYRNIVLSS